VESVLGSNPNLEHLEENLNKVLDSDELNKVEFVYDYILAANLSSFKFERVTIQKLHEFLDQCTHTTGLYKGGDNAFDV
jgi:hypothetical protein